MRLDHESLMLAGGVCAFCLTLWWVRNRELREKYAICWMGIAGLLLICGLFPQFIMDLAAACHLSSPSMVLFLALATIYFFSFGVSVSLTRQYRRSIRVIQDVGLLEQRIAQLEQELSKR